MPAWDNRPKPKGDEICVGVDDGGHALSGNYEIVSANDLGFPSKAAWDAASDDEKLEAVQEYFYGMGYPEWTYVDSSDA